ncbi:MAG: aspartate aminotransferase family protein, partial [Gemmatimonadaceae bacterium]
MQNLTIAPPSQEIDTALLNIRQRYAQENPESRRIFERSQQVMPGGNTRTVLFYPPFPLVMVRGAGAHLWDADGHDYLDFLGDYTAGLFGHSDPDVRAAIVAALDAGVSLSAHNALEVQLAELICRRIPSIERVRFTNSGTEANLMALTAAVNFTGRKKILVFKGGYHGGVLSFAGGNSPVNVPHDFVVVPYNDTESARACIRSHGDALAAVLVEPMLGASGCIPGTAEFLGCLRSETAATRALLIFDEVMTSRLAPGGRQEMLGITPDLTTLGKYIGGGMSFGAFGGREDVMALFDPRRAGALPHAGTFNNNVLTMSAGIVAMGRLFPPEAARRLSARGDALRERLNDCCRTAGIRLQFTGLGSLMSFHACDTPLRNIDDVAGSDPRIKDLYFHHLLS